MQIGINFPTSLIGSDPLAIRDFAQTAEGAGFDYLSAFEHVTGAHQDRFEGVEIPGFGRAPYDHEVAFHEPLTLFAYMAALTERMEFSTGILILPQRQTVLVAKQAAEVDLLSGGRLRLGVGIGWNHTEFEALGEDFHNRGRRVEEQIKVLRLLWQEPLVTYAGRWHTLDRVGINPLPGRQIPIWIGGGTSDVVLRRVARIADGWMPNLFGGNAEEIIGRTRGLLAEEGRSSESLSIQSGLGAIQDEGEWLQRAAFLLSLGVSHLQLSFSREGVSPSQALQAAIKAKGLLESELADKA